MRIDQFHNSVFNYFHDSNKDMPGIEKRTFDPADIPAGYGAFFSVNGFASGTRQKKHLSNINAIFVDIDKTALTKEDLLMEFANYLLPSIINKTKNGFHVYWLLDESIEVTDTDREELTELFEGMNRRLVQLFKGDNAATDITRVLRIPGTEHRKDIDAPFLIETVFNSDANNYTKEEMMEVFEPVSKDVAVVEFGAMKGDVSVVLSKMLEKPHVAALYNGDISDQKGNSEADAALCSHLAFWFGKDPEVMRQVWLESPLGAREKTQKRKDYQDRTINNAISQTTNIYTATKEVDPNDKCPERTEYLEHLNLPFLERRDDWNTRLKWLTAEYIANFHKYFETQYPHLRFEIGEDKSYWNYDEATGVYIAVNFSVVRGYVLQVLIDEGFSLKATEGTAKNIINKFRTVFLERGSKFSDFDNQPDLFHCKNGWLHLHTLEFQDHSPELLSRTVSAVDYDPEATCPLYDQFIDVESRMPKDQIRVIDQYSGYCLTETKEAKKMLIFEGRPGSGKSMLPEAWLEVLGTKAVATSLKRIGGDNQFTGDELMDKTLCFVDEANPKTSLINETFQNLVTQPTILVERKGIQEKSIVPNKLKLVLCLNEMPDHMPPGMDRRYLYIKFTRSFFDEGIQDTSIQTNMLANELPGIFNRMLRGLADYNKMGKKLSMIAGEEQRRQDYALSSDDFSAFLMDHFEPVNDEEVRYTFDDLRNAFVGEYDKPYNKALSKIAFNKKLLANRLPQFSMIGTGIHTGGVGRGYTGFKLKKGKEFDTFGTCVRTTF